MKPMRAVILPLVLPLLACAAASRVTASLPTALPETRPDDFRVSVSTYGGMMPTGSQVACGPAECVVQELRNGVTTEDRGPVSGAELDALYAVVRAHRFDRIARASREPLYDAGGSNIVVTAGGESWSFGDSSEETVADFSRPDFDAVAAATRELTASLGIGTHTGPAPAEVQPG